MHRRRLLLVPLLALLLTCGSATAASWHAFSSKALGFSLRYPAGWKALNVVEPGAKLIQFSYQGGTTSYTLDVTILPLNGGNSSTALKRRFLAFERRAGNTSLTAVHWGATTLAGRRGIGGVYIPATEGGVSVSNGTYVIPWKSRTYVINMVSMQKPAARTLVRFPTIYKQILATWHFL